MESANKIRSALEIQEERVGVKYTDESPGAKPAEGQYAVCSSILEAVQKVRLKMRADSFRLISSSYIIRKYRALFRLNKAIDKRVVAKSTQGYSLNWRNGT